MPRSDSANQQIRDIRRNRIIEASAEVFARKGLAGTKISDLAEAAEMSQGLLYRYFASKEEVFAAAVEVVSEASLQYRDIVREMAYGPTEKLRWLTEQLLLIQQHAPYYAQVIAHALTSEAVGEEIRARAIAETDMLRLALRDIILEGQATGEMIDGDADQLAMLYLAALHSLATGAAVYAAIPLPYPNARTLMAFLCHQPSR